MKFTAGAEAIVTECEYLGYPAVSKKRLPKTYRHQSLDYRLRVQRTKNEAKLLRDAREAGVRTPAIFDINVFESSITMEKIQGVTIKEHIDSFPNDIDNVCASIGISVAKLHNQRIAHGDLTTSNMILSDGKICFIDFSLGTSDADIEAMGVDLHLLERALTSAHPEHPKAFETVLESYSKTINDYHSVMKKMDDIKKRARYT